ncbi:Accessory protein regulator B [Paenibacillus vortex V453]|uniref:Accessory regulator AgrB n=2 Tax=Paenibacillus TaxID=44249 RepID=A0A163EGS8_9BACL|nr:MULTISPECIES: accessory gene regulator B family protein [Paenibacillus]EFU40189.1 Accessory protein regulator B [Paenibacillus vortex V453]KZS43801.1 hypothetical protein AWU65_27350 [Paenibacillus glucanolyticus]MDH6669579.1 accessory gene regulator B [Paenibacillus sp. LBL]
MILESLSKCLATQIKEADPEGPGSIEVLTYGIGLKLNLFTCLVLTALFGTILDTLAGSFFALFSFMALRRFSGGVHLPITLCSIVTAMAASIIPLITMSPSAILCVTTISFVLMLIYAPQYYEAVRRSRWEPWYKWIAACIVGSNFVLVSNILALAFCLQAVLIVPLWKGREEVNWN